MPLSNNKQHTDITEKTSLLLLAIGINALEYLFPRIPFLPWLKPGLANAITIIWIVRWGALDTMIFALVKSWIVSFYFGFSLISLTLSITGGTASVLCMGLLWIAAGRRGLIGLVGLGIAGAVVHNCAQIGVVYFLLTTSGALLYQVPFMIGASLIFGGITGGLAFALLPLLTIPTGHVVLTTPLPPGASVHFDIKITAKNTRLFLGICILILSIGIVMIPSIRMLLAGVILATLLSLFSTRKLSTLLYPIRQFWLLFLFIAIMYLFFSYGRNITGFSIITHEGLRQTLQQWCRLWIWIQLSLVLSKLQFNRILLNLATRYSPIGHETFVAALFALELFPGFFDILRKESRLDLKRMIRHPLTGITAWIHNLYIRICVLRQGQ